MLAWLPNDKIDDDCFIEKKSFSQKIIRRNVFILSRALWIMKEVKRQTMKIECP